MKIALVPNLEKKDAIVYTGLIIDELLENGAEVSLHRPKAGKFMHKDILVFEDYFQMISICDVIIAVGGDGTIIHACKHATEFDKPILGINLGRMGFVADLERNELSFLGQLVSGNYQIQKRMMISVTYNQNGKTVTKNVVNEAVIARGALSKIVDFNVSSKGNVIANYRADGVIVATPTGSTAYSLSAGGPVIDPSMECILLTPVCPFAQPSRTVVFCRDEELSINVSSQYECDIFLTLDGCDGIQLYEGETVRFKASNKYLKMIKLKQNSFLEVVKQKIGN